MRASLALIAAALGLVAASAHDGMHARRMHRVVRRSEAHKHAARACVARASTNVRRANRLRRLTSQSTNSAVKSTKASKSKSKSSSQSKSKSKSKSKGKGKGASNSTATGSNSTSSGSSNNGGLSLNGVQMGLLPDEGASVGAGRADGQAMPAERSARWPR